jgi:hypothetical protein
MDEELDDKEVYLCFVRLIGKENDGYYQYEFIFTDNIDEVWGEDFNQKPACLVNNLMISEEYITEVHTVKTKIKFDLIQDNCCFSVSDCYDGIIALAWEDISQYEEYPEDGRLFFKFGESIDDVDDKLARKHIIMSSYNL